MKCVTTVHLGNIIPQAYTYKANGAWGAMFWTLGNNRIFNLIITIIYPTLIVHPVHPFYSSSVISLLSMILVLLLHILDRRDATFFLD